MPKTPGIIKSTVPGIDDHPAPLAATVIILAGGRSSRMGGRPKALLPWAGATLLEHIAAQARAAARETLVVGGEGLQVPSRVTGVGDVYAGCGPLGGLHAGLRAARFERCVVVGCDMPFVRPRIMRALLARLSGSDAAVPRTAEGPHPLVAAYSRRCLAAVEAQLASDDRRMTSLLGSVRVRWVTERELQELDPDLRCLVNINTCQDYRRAMELARGEPDPG
ncbi:MAG TPA: molybdenum cofactor guanylyltransferase [Armatimonadota bacterium]|nr:molybdenum cofactor guanylyltransferase [Armatimonadota bacterium]